MKDGSIILIGKVQLWSHEFEQWYKKDFGTNAAINFGNYAYLLIFYYTIPAKQKWQKGFFSRSKVKRIEKMISQNPEGNMSLADPYKVLDFLAENLKDNDRVKWSADIRSKIIKQFTK
ncbi:hypothetical protein GCM10027043_05440 [Ferruginibacter profundus]